MCGIGLLCVGGDSTSTSAWLDSLKEGLAARGPDQHGSLELPLGDGAVAHLLASVLHLRGDTMRRQPAVDEDGNVLLWNGEVFSTRPGCGFQVEAGRSDTQVVLDQLRAASQASEEQALPLQLRDVLSCIEGPYAFIYFHRGTRSFLYGRDPLGRRSLLTASSPDGSARVVSSVSAAAMAGFEWQEVDVRGLYWRKPMAGGGVEEELIPWPNGQVSFLRYAMLGEEAWQDQEAQVEDGGGEEDQQGVRAAAEGLLHVLDEAVRRRVDNIPPPPPPLLSHPGGLPPARVAVLFSGGVDCMVVACLAHRHVPADEPIDLINVCFDRDTASPDRLGAIRGRRELAARHPDRAWRLILVDLDFSQVRQHEDRIQRLIQPRSTPMDFNISCAFWCASRGRGRVHDDGARAGAQDDEPADEEQQEPDEDGEDGLGLLRYANGQGGGGVGQAGTIPRRARSDEKLACPGPGCRRAMKHGCSLGLCRHCCVRRQRAEPEGLLYCRVHKEKKKGGGSSSSRPEPPHGGVEGGGGAQQAEGPSAPPPSLPELGGNEADAAAAGDGRGAEAELPQEEATPVAASVSEPAGAEYWSAARVLLLGVGADEQMGGYGRHRAAFHRRGEQGLRRELALDMGRMWIRNLGRDDRIVSDHGRESRLPFLDERVVAFLHRLPLHQKCDMREPVGVGDKQVLRVLAGELLGLPRCARLVKRAIQFGSRIARTANIHNFGSHRAGKGERWRRARPGEVGAAPAQGGQDEEDEPEDDDDSC